MGSNVLIKPVHDFGLKLIPGVLALPASHPVGWMSASSLSNEHHLVVKVANVLGRVTESKDVVIVSGFVQLKLSKINKLLPRVSVVEVNEFNLLVGESILVICRL